MVWYEQTMVLEHAIQYLELKYEVSILAIITSNHAPNLIIDDLNTKRFF
jgi:hypothetical protein